VRTANAAAKVLSLREWVEMLEGNAERTGAKNSAGQLTAPPPRGPVSSFVFVSFQAFKWRDGIRSCPQPARGIRRMPRTGAASMLTGMSDSLRLVEAGTITIVLADDHPVVRSGLRMLLEAENDLEVVSETGDVDATRRSVLGHKPTVLVLDLNMPGGSSLEAIPTMAESSPGTSVVVLTMQEDPAFAREALRAGASGYVLKQAAGTELVQAIRAAAGGGTWLNPELGARMAAAPTTPAGPPGDLTERELDVLRLIALGHTNNEIADQLYLSVRTVETHRAHIQQKLGMSSRAELVRYALDHDLIER
jgi:two-component system, NarL family, response regulator NreC